MCRALRVRVLVFLCGCAVLSIADNVYMFAMFAK